ncbi:MAG: hypothetical protein HFG01_08620, partial [Oscillibacter sp.]|nr:hypothetical protein [Oscillibacter sp.]
IGDEGTLEILSGQRRHLIATELNYPVPTIIQKISDADAKILVADGNLHRPHISMYDLSRSLRMKEVRKSTILLASRTTTEMFSLARSLIVKR